MKRGLTGLGFAFVVVALAACGEASTPKWPVDNGKSAKIYFGSHAKPTRVAYVLGKRADRVIYEFDRQVACGGCSRPSGTVNPSGRFAVVVFDRAAHRLLEFKLCGSREACDSGSRPVRPPKADM